MGQSPRARVRRCSAGSQEQVFNWLLEGFGEKASAPVGCWGASPLIPSWYPCW
jgi:hypothetical protein